MNQTATRSWEAKRTDETFAVEEALKKAGFDHVDAYRYNSASIRVRVIDPRFDGLSAVQRDAMIEPVLDQLPERTQADIMNLFTFAPSEVQQSSNNLKEYLRNAEFDDPSPSIL